MKCDWKYCKLKDICVFPKISVTPVADLLYYHYSLPAFDKDKTPEVTEGKNIKSNKYIVSNNLILYNKLNLRFKRIWKILKSQKHSICSTEFILIRPVNININYLYYYLMLDKTTKELEATRTGTSSSHQRIKPETLYNYSVPLPSEYEQKAIADILSCLDDKIELNNRINKNLEAQAQAIFKSWFVDFEPFQDGEFVDSELGRIPKGWVKDSLSSICRYSNQKVAVETLCLENYFSTENMLPNKNGATVSPKLPNSRLTTACKKGDTLISNIRPYFKKIHYCCKDGGCSTDVLCFEPKNKIFSLYLYRTLYADLFFEYMVTGSKGTKMPRGDKQQIMQYSILVPEKKVIEEFNLVVGTIVEQITHRKAENILLSILRDTLLPKLMSGEIRVPQEV